ncbi:MULTISPECIES: DUF3592 domain-containing protein [Marinobacter]|uniref:DUF3592 domain-containing protein n=1 Tax=Marinobacter TaxID=2742 RepID=UPI000DE8B49E|nr:MULTISPECIES: DUF3592 domain-containing protein [Marinobacter]
MEGLIIIWVARLVLLVIIFLGFWRYYFGIKSKGWPVTDGLIISGKSEYYANPSGVNGHILNIKYRYKVSGKNYTSTRINFSLNESAGNKAHAEELLNNYRNGRVVKVYYNPNNPEQSVIEPGNNNLHLFITMTLGIVCVGGIAFSNYIF